MTRRHREARQAKRAGCFGGPADSDAVCPLDEQPCDECQSGVCKLMEDAAYDAEAPDA